MNFTTCWSRPAASLGKQSLPEKLSIRSRRTACRRSGKAGKHRHLARAGGWKFSTRASRGSRPSLVALHRRSRVRLEQPCAMNIESLNCVGRETRRDFLKKAATVAVALGAPELHTAL